MKRALVLNGIRRKIRDLDCKTLNSVQPIELIDDNSLSIIHNSFPYLSKYATTKLKYILVSSQVNVTTPLCLNQWFPPSHLTISSVDLLEAFFNLSAELKTGPNAVYEESSFGTRESIIIVCTILFSRKVWHFHFLCTLSLDLTLPNRRKHR